MIMWTMSRHSDQPPNTSRGAYPFLLSPPPR
jgi:hypothetical protein